MPLHAKEDQAHAELIWRQIEQVFAAFPGADQAIEFGFDCLALVYPSLIWDEALVRTKAELGWADGVAAREPKSADPGAALASPQG